MTAHRVGLPQPQVTTYFKDAPKPKRRWRRPVKPVSNRRAAANVIRKANCFEAFGPYPECGACGPLALVGVSRATTGCRGYADDAHEILSRGRGGSITETDGIVPVSRACHRFIDDHDDIAQAAGLSRPSEPGT